MSECQLFNDRLFAPKPDPVTEMAKIAGHFSRSGKTKDEQNFLLFATLEQPTSIVGALLQVNIAFHEADMIQIDPDPTAQKERLERLYRALDHALIYFETMLGYDVGSILRGENEHATRSVVQ